MTKSQLFVKYHWKQIVAMFVVVVAVITWQVTTEEVAIKKAKNGQVAGATDINQTTTENEKNTQLIITYQAELKNSVTKYFRQRAFAGADAIALIKAIDQAKNEILALGVPSEYKELHLKIATTLDLEKEAVLNNSAEDNQTAEKSWEEILQQYFWLNN